MKPGTKPHLSAKTVSVLNALARFVPGGATAEQLGKICGISTRSARNRLVWLRRGGLVRYVPTQGGRWHLADDQMFGGTNA